MHPDHGQLLVNGQFRIVNTELGLVDGDLGGPRCLLGAVKDEDVAWIRDPTLKFLAETDGVGHFADARRVHLERKVCVRQEPLGACSRAPLVERAATYAVVPPLHPPGPSCFGRPIAGWPVGSVH